MADIEVARGNMTKIPEWCEEAGGGRDSMPTNDIRLTKISIRRERGDAEGAQNLCCRMLEKFPGTACFWPSWTRLVQSDAPSEESILGAGPATRLKN